MNIDLTDTTSGEINTALVRARRAAGAPAVGMVLTLVIVTDEGNHYDALRAASEASKEHPARTLVVIRRPGRSPRDRAAARLDAEVRVGGDTGIGETVLLRGACIHSDNGVLGAASIARAEERRIQLLKEAGFNAIRMAHNPASPSMLDACDRLDRADDVAHGGLVRRLAEAGRARGEDHRLVEGLGSG